MPPGRRWLVGTALVSSLLPGVNAFYLPGAAPHDYHVEEPVRLLVNALTPMLASSDGAKIVRWNLFMPPLLPHTIPPEICD